MDPTFLNDTDLTPIDNPIVPDEGVVFDLDPLSLDIPDDELVKVVDNTIDESKKFWKNKYNLTERRRRMEIALFGRQVQEKEKKDELKKYESRYSNNALYEIEATLKPVAMSHLPDLIVTPGNETPESEVSAEDISKAVNDDLKKRQFRQAMGLCFKHLPVYFTAILKARWNPEKEDYEFYVVHPDNVIIDRAATSANVDDMRFVSELLTLTVQDLVMRFPGKKDKLFAKLKGQGLVTGDTEFTWKDLASEVKIWEVWFTWFKKSTPTPQIEGEILEEPGNKWEKIEGVLWKYDDIILKKIKNPNYDHEGDVKWFTYADPSDENTKQEVAPQDMLMSALSGQLPPNVSQEQVYFNYFKQPKKPYFFFGYDQWGKVAIDETSRIEQNVYNQESLNDQGTQIMDTLKARIKHIWSTDSGLKAEDVQALDMDNPKLDALIDGNVNDAHTAIQPERPDVAQFNALQTTKDDMFALAGATSLTGQVQSDTATTNQIAREQNFTRADDLVEDTINAASEWMASWALQFIKLRYTEEKFRKLLGDKGKITFLKLKRDKIEDGMEVMIKASGTDKLKAQRNAMDMAKLGPPYVNPLDFFKDMDISDPDGRAERGLVMAIDPNMYFTKYVLGLENTVQQATALNGVPPDGTLPPSGASAPQTPPTGQPAPPPMAPTPQDTTAMPVAQPPFPTGSVRGV